MLKVFSNFDSPSYHRDDLLLCGNAGPTDHFEIKWKQSCPLIKNWRMYLPKLSGDKSQLSLASIHMFRRACNEDLLYIWNFWQTHHHHQRALPPPR